MCHHTLTSFRRAVRRMPTALMITCGIMITTITVSTRYQLDAVPNTGSGASAGTPSIRVAAPMM